MRGPAGQAASAARVEAPAPGAVLSPRLQLLQRCWRAAPGCSTGRAELGAGAPEAGGGAQTAVEGDPTLPGLRDSAPACQVPLSSTARRSTNLSLGGVRSPRLSTLWGGGWWWWGAGEWGVRGSAVAKGGILQGSLPGAAPLPPSPIAPCPHPVAAGFAFRQFGEHREPVTCDPCQVAVPESEVPARKQAPTRAHEAMTAMKQEQRPTPGPGQPGVTDQVSRQLRPGPPRKADSKPRSPCPSSRGSAPTPPSPHPAPVPGSPQLIHGLCRKLEPPSALRGRARGCTRWRAAGKGQRGKGRVAWAAPRAGPDGGRWPGPRSGDLLAPTEARWRNCCSPGGFHSLGSNPVFT